MYCAGTRIFLGSGLIFWCQSVHEVWNLLWRCGSHRSLVDWDMFWYCCGYGRTRSRRSIRFIPVSTSRAMFLEAVYCPSGINLGWTWNILDSLLLLVLWGNDDVMGAVSVVSSSPSRANSVILRASSRMRINLLLSFISFNDWWSGMVCTCFLLSFAMVRDVNGLDIE